MVFYQRQEHWFSFKDCCISVLETSPLGSTNALRQTLFFLHGRLGESDMWSWLTKELSKQFRCITFDFPGFGKSFSAINRPFSFLEHASLVDQVIQKLTVPKEQVILVGHDFGGGIAQLSTIRSPKKMKALIMINSPGMIRRLGKLRIGFRGWLIRSRLKRLFKETKMSDEAESLLYSPWKNPVSRDPISKAIDALEDSWPCHYERLLWKLALPNLDQPVLLLWGKKDSINPPEMAFDLIQRIPEVHFYQNEDAGHWPCFEQPEWVISKIQEFIFRLNIKPAQKSLLR